MINKVGASANLVAGEVRAENQKRQVSAEDKQQSKIEKLKAEIESGEYTVNLKETAKKMAEELRP